MLHFTPDELDGVVDEFVGGLGVGDGVAVFFEKDEGAFAGGEFLVAGHVGEDVDGGDVVVEDEREFELGEQVDDAFRVGGVEVGEFFGKEEGGPHAERDGFAVQEFAVGNGGLDGVTDGVPEVKQGPGAGGLLFVLLDDACLDGDVVGEESGVG